MDVSDFIHDGPVIETMDLRFAALEYAIGILVATLEQGQPQWNERLPGLCEAASLDFGTRMRRAGVLVDPDDEKLLASFMHGFLLVR